MSVENIDKIAQGRVWLGTDALKIKLIDQLGGIKEAVEKACVALKDAGAKKSFTTCSIRTFSLITYERSRRTIKS